LPSAGRGGLSFSNLDSTESAYVALSSLSAATYAASLVSGRYVVTYLPDPTACQREDSVWSCRPRRLRGCP
jgi:hypothetical protein